MRRNLLFSLTLLLAVLLCAPSVLRADTIVAGSMKAPGESLTYYFDVQQFIEPTFVEDVLAYGKVVFKDGKIGCHPCTSTYIDDFYIFGFTETVTIAQFSFNGSTWNLLGSLNNVRLVDPPS